VSPPDYGGELDPSFFQIQNEEKLASINRNKIAKTLRDGFIVGLEYDDEIKAESQSSKCVTMMRKAGWFYLKGSGGAVLRSEKQQAKVSYQLLPH
jgi:hypothetical protein